MPVTIKTGVMKYKDPTTGNYVDVDAVGNILSDTIAPDYSDLTYPVAAGKLCYHESKLYFAKQAISTVEVWTASHWDEVTVEEELNRKYTKPSGGIPASDIANGVIPDVSGFYTKPASGIPASDIASGVIPDPEDLIDDEAGEGDTDKVWSADKISDETSRLSGAIDAKPDVKDSTETGVDLDVSDENGNVIVRLKDGHIQTKNFNSEDTSVMKNSTESGIDLDVSDGNGNVLARFASGGIETKGLKGYKYKEFIKNGTTSNQSITVTISQHFNRGDRIVLHTDRGVYPYNAPWNTGVSVTYYEDDRPIISNARIDIAYIEHTITADTSSISVTYDGTLSSGNQTVTLHVYLLGDIPITPNIIRVKKDGTGDYTSLRDAVDAIGLNADDYIHPYVIEVYPGVYDVLADYDDTEINTAVSSFNDTSFVGLKLLNGVSLVGAGNPDNIILTASLSTTDYTSDVRGGISTINKQGSGSIENVTIVSHNLRYCVHDDFGSQKAKRIKRIYKNCIFRAYNSAYTPDTSYGAGMPIGGMDAEFINCDFGENGGLHLNSQLTSFVTERFVNCKGLGFRIGDNTTVTNSTISEYIFENCDFEHIYYGMSGETPHVRIRGSGNKPVMINAPDSVMYTMDSVVPVPIERLNADVGDVVERYAQNTHGPRYQAATSVDKACGIVVFKDSDDVYIQTAGYVKTDRAGLSSFNLNDYVGLNNGVPVVVQNAENAFGRIKFIDSDNNGYIYLNWR